jgi:hypothetical protein
MTDRPERGGPRRPLISPQTLAIVLILASLIVIAVWLATRSSGAVLANARSDASRLFRPGRSRPEPCPTGPTRPARSIRQ